MTRINYHDMNKKKYSRPTICTVRGSELMQTPPLNFGTGTIDGNDDSFYGTGRTGRYSRRVLRA